MDHETRAIQFTLVVDVFGIKYLGNESAMHLISALKESRNISEDWRGNKYINLTLDWGYKGKHVHLSMLGCVDKALKWFGHEKRRKHQDQQKEHVPPEHGTKQQFCGKRIITSNWKGRATIYLSSAGNIFVQSKGVDPTLLMPLSVLASKQAKSIVKTMSKIKQKRLHCISGGDHTFLLCQWHDFGGT